MAILDVFVSVFEADTKGLRDGQKKAAQTTDELVASMRDAEKQAQSTTDKLKRFAQGALGFLATAAAIRKTIGMSTEQAEMVATLDRTATAIGANVSELDALQRSFVDAGVSAESAGNAAASVFQSAMDAARSATSEQAKVMGQLGVSLRNAEGRMKDGVTLMLDMAGAAERLDDAAATDLFRRMGITDPQVQEQMLRGRKALEDQMRAHKQAGVITAEQVEMARKYTEAQGRLSNSMQRGAQTVMSMFLPALTWAVDKLSAVVDWATQNKWAVVGFFSSIAVAVSTLYLPAMINAAAATLAATWPILAIAAVIGALSAVIALVVDDVMAWIAGNDSLIGQILEKFPIIGQTIEAVVGAAVASFNFLRDVVSSVIGWIFERIQAVTGAVQKVGRFFGFGKGGDVDVIAKQANAALNVAASNELNPVTSSAISNTTQRQENNVSIGELNIETQATDAQGVASSARSELQSQLRDLQAESASGVDR